MNQTLATGLRVLLLGTVVGLVAVPAAPAQGAAANKAEEKLTPELKAKVLRLFELMRLRESIQASIHQQIGELKASNSLLSAEALDRMEKEFDLNELLSRIVPVYARRFSEQELDALIKIHENPVFQKFQGETDGMAKEVASLSEAYGEEVGKKVAAMMLLEGKSTVKK